MSSQLALRRALVSARSMRVGVRAYTEGATGSNRPESSGDSFTVSNWFKDKELFSLT